MMNPNLTIASRSGVFTSLAPRLKTIFLHPFSVLLLAMPFGVLGGSLCVLVQNRSGKWNSEGCEATSKERRQGRHERRVSERNGEIDRGSRPRPESKGKREEGRGCGADGSWQQCSGADQEQ